MGPCNEGEDEGEGPLCEKGFSSFGVCTCTCMLRMFSHAHPCRTASVQMILPRSTDEILCQHTRKFALQITAC
jgi:hypothetical protein